MHTAILTLAACLISADLSPENRGVIAGTVVNASQDKTPVAGCEVVLRVKLEGQFVPFRNATTDDRGRFRFAALPVGKYYEYWPGANRDGVHYPGPQVSIAAEQPSVLVELPVCDSIAEPSPLVIRRQEIVLRPEPGVLRVTESLTIENPASASYVGKASKEGGEPITLQLGIPADFEQRNVR